MIRRTKCPGSGSEPVVEYPDGQHFLSNGWLGAGRVIHHCPMHCGKFWTYNDNKNGWAHLTIPKHFVKEES
jgi:hypothetical protein